MAKWQGDEWRPWELATAAVAIRALRKARLDAWWRPEGWVEGELFGRLFALSPTGPMEVDLWFAWANADNWDDAFDPRGYEDAGTAARVLRKAMEVCLAAADQGLVVWFSPATARLASVYLRGAELIRRRGYIVELFAQDGDELKKVSLEAALGGSLQTTVVVFSVRKLGTPRE